MKALGHHRHVTKDRRDEFGERGESLAASVLVARGFRILERRWTSGVFGCPEIDIVCELGDMVVFVEVKTRSNLRFGPPAAAVTAAKQASLRRAAHAWFSLRRGDHRKWRIDVIAILWPPGEKPQVKHYVNAVGGE